ncbi:P-loop containing nucleoside triphosphate hydrolase protein [Mycena galopus ATCC 62051]|nr:P-loop containing nucleoside triphosphate hydrolase protein [Mycena galopus ATCC 62051]
MAGKDLVVRSGTGSGKTLAMILPVFLLPKTSAVITVSPLRLIQDNHVAEFAKYGITSIAINCFTPEDEDLWQSIRSHSKYQHYSVSPEQCGPFMGHIPRFAKLLHDPKWTKHVKLLQIDEAHFIVTAGKAKGKEAVFRPSFSNLGERLRIHLPASTPCTAYSASLPPQIMNTVKSTLRMEPSKTITIELTTNRPNLVYAVIPMIGTVANFSNLDFLLPLSFPPNFVLSQKSMVFLDNKRKSPALAAHLNSKLPTALAARQSFRVYHSSMSKPYLEAIAASFKNPNGDVKCLIATEAASNGFDVADVDLIIQFGAPKSIIDKDQRGGRGGRDGRECLVLMIAERWAYEDLARFDPEHKPSKKEERTDAAVIAYASSRKDCRRRTLAKHNNDTTAEGQWCCDNDTDEFDLSHYLLSPILSDVQSSDSMPPVKTPRKKYRPVLNREPIVSALEEWRSAAHTRDPVARNFPPSYILDDNSIAQLARAVSGSFRIPNDISDFLGETPEWHSRYALKIVTIVRQHDLTVLPARRRRDTNSNSGTSDSDTSDDSSSSSSESDSEGDEIPTPTQEDFGTVISAASLHSSPSSSRANSPTEPPAVSSSGRPLRQSAINHRVAGIAEHMVRKKQKV